LGERPAEILRRHIVSKKRQDLVPDRHAGPRGSADINSGSSRDILTGTFLGPRLHHVYSNRGPSSGALRSERPACPSGNAARPARCSGNSGNAAATPPARAEVGSQGAADAAAYWHSSTGPQPHR